MIWIWTGFIFFVLLMLALDLGVFHRHAHVVMIKEALLWSGVWVALGLSFAIFVYFGYERHWLGLGAVIDPVDSLLNDGSTATIKYLTGYVVEKSLSIDNVFVIAMIFRYFAVPAMYQHRVLFWGVLGALVLRAAMIGIGARLIQDFHWVLYLFGVFLVFTGIKMLTVGTEKKNLERNIAVRLARRLFPVTTRFHGEHLVVRAGTAASHESELPGGAEIADEKADRAEAGTLMLTPLGLALIAVEASDIVFAVDSIPAIFAITADPFLVFTSNVFAILGLRSLYFALAAMIEKFRYLKVSLAVILVLVGVKMLAVEQLKHLFGKNFNFYLLGAILLILATGVAVSVWQRRKA